MANEALNLALNYIGVKVYVGDYIENVNTDVTGVTQIKGVVKVGNPGGIERNVQNYATLDGDGWQKKVPTLLNAKDIELEVAYEDEASIKLLRGLVVASGTDMYKNFYFVPNKRADWTTGISFYCAVAVTETTPKDATADDYQAATFKLSVQGAIKDLGEHKVNTAV